MSAPLPQSVSSLQAKSTRAQNQGAWHQQKLEWTTPKQISSNPAENLSPKAHTEPAVEPLPEAVARKLFKNPTTAHRRPHFQLPLVRELLQGKTHSQGCCCDASGSCVRSGLGWRQPNRNISKGQLQTKSMSKKRCCSPWYFRAQKKYSRSSCLQVCELRGSDYFGLRKC